MSGTNGGALPAQGRAELGMGRDFGTQGRVGVTRWVLSLAKGDMCVLSRSVVSDSS